MPIQCRYPTQCEFYGQARHDSRLQFCYASGVAVQITKDTECDRGNKKRGNKFNAVKTQVDGIWFDSGMEAEYYGILKLLRQAGEIEFKIHPKYPLTKTISWKLDFEVTDLKTGIITYIDVKGQRLPSFNRNLRLWHEAYPDRIITLKTKKGKYWEDTKA